MGLGLQVAGRAGALVLGALDLIRLPLVELDVQEVLVVVLVAHLTNFEDCGKKFRKCGDRRYRPVEGAYYPPRLRRWRGDSLPVAYAAKSRVTTIHCEPMYILIFLGQ